ncbi:hypothetical protein [Streptomyces tsukubensis]|uniref:Htaa domain-containing protein n=1 Tax=Streptomyces tsukubensis TaxID=83656 RepID=A0A1V3ZZC5_9ACTN|nr:hypothetical protein [Streptomyces tsukubensis]OON71340.1 hypothetical protein B1H18_34240 [Streptomyces tsukubensis]QFR96690.1 hypothetical protein GBW32_31225 [Streptomyces tsukubensis]
MNKSSLRLAALMVGSLAVLAAVVPPVSAGEAGGVLPPLPLKAGDPYYFCLTDATETALAKARISLQAVSPNTVVTYKAHTCMRGTLTSGQINTDLTGLSGEGTGGFAFQRDAERAEFVHPRVTLSPDMTGSWTAEHAGRRIEMFTSTKVGAKFSLTKVSATDLPMTLTKQGADVLADTFGTSPLPAGTPFFEGNASFDVLNSLTAPLTTNP